MRAFLSGRGLGEDWFRSVDEEATDYAADIRRRTLELTAPTSEVVFEHTYSEPHVAVAEQREWLERYERSFEADAPATPSTAEVGA
jgi:pyruvate dehydrogenase E1 component alpha subunit